MNIIDQISGVVESVHNLDTTPAAGIMQISQILDANPGVMAGQIELTDYPAGEPRRVCYLPPEPAGIPRRVYVFAIYSTLAAGLLLGILLGWGLRARSTDDRYLRALAGQYTASERYYNSRIDTTIKENERTYANGKKKD